MNEHIITIVSNMIQFQYRLTVLYWPYNSSTAYAGTDKGNIYFIYVDWQEHHQSQCSCNISAQLYWCEEIVYWNKVVISSK